MTTAPPTPRSAVAGRADATDNVQSSDTPVRGVLDEDALRRLRELDPTGENHLLMRVINAFEISLNRLVPQLTQARDASDASGVRLVAHTLKSSSATVGALTLSRLCAEVEVLARESRLDEAGPGVSQMLLEADAVRESLRGLTPPSDNPAGSA